MDQLPTIPVEASSWDQALYAFLVEKGNRSGSRRTVESYSRMLWRLFKGTTPDQLTPAVVLAYAHGIGLSGKTPSPVIIGARIACLSSYFRFLIRMGLVTSNPCDLVERPMEHDPEGTDESYGTPAPERAREMCELTPSGAVTNQRGHAAGCVWHRCICPTG